MRCERAGKYRWLASLASQAQGTGAAMLPIILRLEVRRSELCLASRKRKYYHTLGRTYISKK